MQSQNEVERYSAAGRWLHWVHSGAFLILVITGVFFFVPWFGDAGIAGVSRFFHRIGAIIFIVAPLLMALASPKKAIEFIKENITWGKDDIAWVKAAPDYYFGGDERKMLPQGRVNTGQKLYGVTVLGGSVAFLVTGIMMWFFRGEVSPTAFQWAVFVHDAAFIAVFSFFLVHTYLSALHPRMTESLRSMIGGKVSVHYAQSHYGKWYAEITKDEKK